MREYTGFRRQFGDHNRATYLWGSWIRRRKVTHEFRTGMDRTVEDAYLGEIGHGGRR